MYRPINRRVAALLAVVALFAAGSAFAMVATPATTSASTTTAPASATATAAKAAAQQQRLANIKTKGSAEINRRLTQLKSLTALIASAAHITAADKTSLTTQVSGEVGGLTSLESQLNSETTLAAAITDAQSIYSDYRVYALITPKIHVIKVSDDQQVNETNLTNLAVKLQSRLTTAQAQGKNVTALQASLADLTTKVKAAQAISSSIETAVIGLQPSDYDSNHAVLSGDMAQLQAAHADNQAAFTDAKTVVQGIKSL